jgi:ribosomal protein S18 acetylase RimI-like enzyme
VITLRTVPAADLPWFASLPGVPDPDLATLLASQLADGRTTPDRILVGTGADGRPVGRAALVVDDPAGPLEAWLSALWVADEPDMATGAVARALVDGLVAAAPDLRVPLDARVNAETHADPAARCALLEAAGFVLFQEKLGATWVDDGSPIREPGRLVLTPVTEAGRDALAAVMARATAGTLDRNDAYFRELVGPVDWGRIMQAYATPADDPTWCIARLPDGRDVGYVLLSAFDEPGVGTITHIGVVPEQRGHGYVVDLLLHANEAARARGFGSILSDVDTRNRPMLGAMARAGHREGVRAWHLWHYRRPIG